MKLKVSITDSVLDEKDWPVAELTLDSMGFVIKQVALKDGVYSLPDFTNKNLVDIQDWLAHDPTGSWPEMYNELV